MASAAEAYLDDPTAPKANATRNDIAAASAAHHELSRDYDGAVAEA